MKRIVFFLTLFLFININGCSYNNQPTPKSVQVCVGKKTMFNACGSGFFISENTLITAYHVIKWSEDDIVTIRGPRNDKQTTIFDVIPEIDVTFVYFENKTVNNYWTICETVRNNSKAIVYGVVDLKKGVESRKLIVDHTALDKIYLIGEVQHGFSGGPIIDVDYGCVIGLLTRKETHGNKFIKATNLTDDWNGISFYIREYRTKKQQTFAKLKHKYIMVDGLKTRIVNL